jgi:hypothetical protein
VLWSLSCLCFSCLVFVLFVFLVSCLCLVYVPRVLCFSCLCSSCLVFVLLVFLVSCVSLVCVPRVLCLSCLYKHKTRGKQTKQIQDTRGKQTRQTQDTRGKQTRQTQDTRGKQTRQTVMIRNAPLTQNPLRNIHHTISNGQIDSWGGCSVFSNFSSHGYSFYLTISLKAQSVQLMEHLQKYIVHKSNHKNYIFQGIDISIQYIRK